MEFKKLDNQYLDACVNIAAGRYSEEQKAVPALYFKDYEKEIYKSVKHIFDNDTGIMAFEKGELAGYLSFGEIWEEHDNLIKGISSPLCGYGISKGYDRGKIASLLFQHASEILCKKGVGIYNITVYAHDIDVITSYVLNNFGILCTDAIRIIELPICAEPIGKYTYEELSAEEIDNKADCLLEMWHKLVEHLRMSPTYYPGEEFTDSAFLDYIHEEGTRVFVAKEQKNIIGMIDVSKDGNNFVTREEDTMNVGDLYLKPLFRGQNITQELLLYVSNTLKKEGVKRLWVEHGTTNPTAQHFWGKYFNRFTYTLTRKIDERILTK
ncbi:GNAT family N-acetyltransferase [Clostridium estertheticum]|uniref:GNAT family N-acetyltransferase n=1 Tax=Clostridium estertheticum TaxID=238834 RepID=UPI0013E97E42|nr:GNAT family N-acetyltransferase [Clostridium estertheticum]MBZ9689626.1 GNAT family N-acetyltransferase [Clostridium estertheticum]